MDLLPELVSLIAFQSHGSWYSMSSIDRTFHEYACSQAGKDKFRELFMTCGPFAYGYEWRLNDILHNFDDAPAEICEDGTQFWYQHGKLHRDNGPAVIYLGGTQHWYQRGKRHRDNGPAIIRHDGLMNWYRCGEYCPDWS